MMGKWAVDVRNKYMSARGKPVVQVAEVAPKPEVLTSKQLIAAARKDKDLALIAVLDERYARLRMRYARHSMLVKEMPRFSGTPPGFLENETWTVLNHQGGPVYLWLDRYVMPEDEDEEDEDYVVPVAWFEERMSAINPPVAVAAAAKGTHVREAYREEHTGDRQPGEGMAKLKAYGVGIFFGALVALGFMWLVNSSNNTDVPPTPTPIVAEVER